MKYLKLHVQVVELLKSSMNFQFKWDFDSSDFIWEKSVFSRLKIKLSKKFYSRNPTQMYIQVLLLLSRGKLGVRWNNLKFKKNPLNFAKNCLKGKSNWYPSSLKSKGSFQQNLNNVSLAIYYILKQSIELRMLYAS